MKKQKHSFFQVFIAAALVLGLTATAGCAQQGSGASSAAGSAGESAKAETSSDSGNLNKAKVIHVGFQGASYITNMNKRLHYFEDEFEKDGIKVEFEQFLSGPPMIEAIASGRVDIGEVGDMPPINARASGIDLKIICRNANTQFSNSLVVPNGSPIKTVKDLKGKKVATQVGSSAHHFLALILQKNGLSLKDVQLVNMPVVDHVAALQNGEVAAVTTWEPYGSVIENKKAGKILLDSTGIKQNTSTFIARSEFAKENPEIAARYLKVWLKIVDYIKEDRQRALAIISEESKFAKSDLEKTLLAADFTPNFVDYDYEQMELTKKFLLDTKVLKKDYDIKELYDFSYLEQAKKLYEADKK